MREKIRLSTFRANPAYDAIPYNRLSDAERQTLSPLEKDSDNYGVLRAKHGNSLPLMSISKDTALLFLTLQEPGPLPDYITCSISKVEEHALTGLVFDKILEIAGPNGYVSGPDAVSILGIHTRLNDNRIMQLSRAALCYGHALKLSDPVALSFKLYLYNRLPASRRWRRILPNREAVIGFLDIGRSQKNAAVLKQYWNYQENTEGWISFTARASNQRKYGSTYKIYVSPKPEALPEVFGTICETLATSGATQFKVGDNFYGLLRPDKLVAYFTSKEALLTAAAALSARLKGLPAHGVPFTAEAGGDGLLSWGMDPRGVPGMGGLSWRQWITNRLAATLIIALNSTHETDEIHRFALERLRLEGVDPNTFAPTASWTGEQII